MRTDGDLIAPRDRRIRRDASGAAGGGHFRARIDGLTRPVVVLLGFATAALADAAVGPWSGKEAGETPLLRQLLGGVLAGGVLVADRAMARTG